MLYKTVIAEGDPAIQNLEFNIQNYSIHPAANAAQSARSTNPFPSMSATPHSGDSIASQSSATAEEGYTTGYVRMPLFTITENVSKKGKNCIAIY